MTYDRKALERDLRGEIAGEVRFTPGDRALYATGGSNYRQLPIGVVIPRTIDDVVTTHAVCRAHGAPILSRGGGTSLAGQACNVAVVIDFSKYLNRILEIDPERRLARVQPGLVLDHLRNEAEQEHRLTYGPDPSTHDHCTFGGMVGNNSCGVHSVMTEFYGDGPLTADNVEELEVLTYRGERLRVGRGDDGLPPALATGLRELAEQHADRIRERYPDIPRRVSGYNLDRLLPERGFDVAAALVGTESTCVTVLEATVKLVNSPPARSLLVLGYEDAPTAGDRVPDVREHRPLGLEGVDDVLLQDMSLIGQHQEDLSLLPEGRGYLVVEFGGDTKEEADEKAHALMADAKKHRGLTGMKLYDDPASEGHVWQVREAGLGATAFIPGKADTYEGWEDSAVPPERVGDYLRDLSKLGAKFGYESALYGHYGQGCIHARWNFDLVTKEGIRTFRRFLDEASDLVVSYRGSLSGEHGDGQSKAELLPKMFGEELVGAFRDFKRLWDPDGMMNPGKIVDPFPSDSNLRLGTDFAPPRVQTHFAYPQDHGSFVHAAVRCVGIGKCRRTEGGDEDGGVMCPSYMVTREEKHTTRGRARLLFEMVRGTELELWRSKEVLEALDLCLSCKGCTHDCPVSVDLPTLKAEFLAHHYTRRLRPRHAYAFGLVDQAARHGARVPRLVNLVGRGRLTSRLVKAAVGIAPQRELPAFAPQTLQAWYRTRGGSHAPGGRRVLLWPDTFTNHFHAEIGIAAVEALEAAGFSVVVPDGHVCCGRPLYDYGMLGRARHYLEDVIGRFREEIRAGTPFVGVEPSCLAVFKDELPKLLPHDEDGKRLCRQAVHFADLLKDAEYEPPQLRARQALLHGHCHHKATGGLDGERSLLEAMGLEVDLLNSGCCGLAGSWGYEKEHYGVSMACGERVLLPRVRDAAPEALIVADGFSCRTQIEHGAGGRRALHVAQVLRLAQQGAVLEAFPEREAPSAAERAAA
jgi:FAD/FMN-containing dehydrogenase/Fe-S oxidoreductase